MAVLELTNLRKAFVSPDGEQTPIIDVPRFSLEAGAQLALQGASGSGKTTLLNLIAGILNPDGGTIRLAGHELTSASEAQRDRIRGRHVGIIFQTFNLLQGYTALENVELAMRFGRGLRRGFARSLLERVGLADRLRYRPQQLSVGQQQRVAVARALANRPELVLADEPTGNLDRRHAQSAIELIREICQENGAALLVVTHDALVLDAIGRSQDLDRINRADGQPPAARAEVGAALAQGPAAS